MTKRAGAQRRQRPWPVGDPGCQAPTPPAWSARPGISMSMWRWRFRAARTSTASPNPSPPWWRGSAKPCSTPSISSTATRPIRTTRSPASRAAHDAGARWLVLCDTNGGTMPEDVYRIVCEVKAKLPGAALGIHAHNDTEQAVAVSLAALRGGARQIQGTLNGLGERCGNANLCSLLPTLMLKEPYASQFETGVSRREQLARMTACLAPAGRNPQPRAGPPRGLCRPVGLRAQGRPAFLRRAEGPAHL